MKTSELTGALLDYWVARATGVPAFIVSGGCWRDGPLDVYSPSVDWAQGGPLIEKYRMRVDANLGEGWYASAQVGVANSGGTPLDAICRAVVRSVFGDEVEEVPAC